MKMCLLLQNLPKFTNLKKKCSFKIPPKLTRHHVDIATEMLFK